MGHGARGSNDKRQHEDQELAPNNAAYPWQLCHPIVPLGPSYLTHSN